MVHEGIPALLRAGAGLVISPLIALMQDQVDALRQVGLRAAFLNSTQDIESQRAIERALLDGALDLLYIAPERLLSPRMMDLLAHTRLARLAGPDVPPEARRKAGVFWPLWAARN